MENQKLKSTPINADVRIGFVIRQLRRKYHLTQTHIANVINTGQNNVLELEKGRRRLIFTEAANLCKFFDISIDYFYELVDKIEFGLDLKQQLDRDIVPQWKVNE